MGGPHLNLPLVDTKRNQANDLRLLCLLGIPSQYRKAGLACVRREHGAGPPSHDGRNRLTDRVPIGECLECKEQTHSRCLRNAHSRHGGNVLSQSTVKEKCQEGNCEPLGPGQEASHGA